MTLIFKCCINYNMFLNIYTFLEVWGKFSKYSLIIQQVRDSLHSWRTTWSMPFSLPAPGFDRVVRLPYLYNTTSCLQLQISSELSSPVSSVVSQGYTTRDNPSTPYKSRLCETFSSFSVQGMISMT